MAWTKPEYSRAAVDRAGRILAESETTPVADIEMSTRATRVINNWRSSHAFPLNTFQVNLRTKTRTVDRTGFVAQRIKRLPAIQHKLERFPTMHLSGMQDVGGCRAVVSSVPQVRGLRQLLKASRAKHKPAGEHDYIETPKEDGYRSHHVVYRYHSDRTETYEGLKIEIQLRTQLQHTWATTVEIVGQVRQEMLKSDEGDEDWLRFFALMGTALARREGCPDVPNTPSSHKALAEEVRRYAEKLDVVQQLESYRRALRVIPRLREAVRAHFYLLSLDLEKQEISYRAYKKSEAEEASSEYQLRERRSFAQEGPNVVLVSVDSAALIGRAYPNFFLDSDAFLTEVHEIIG